MLMKNNFNRSIRSRKMLSVGELVIRIGMELSRLKKVVDFWIFIYLSCYW